MQVLSSRPVAALLQICFVMILAAFAAAGSVDNDTITVQGTGYPPIRAESAAQAHLMAKRAAVVSAYRNALSAGAQSGSGGDVTYQELSGFVSGLTIVEEEYLKDGGIRITAKVPRKNVAISSLPGTEGRRTERSNNGIRGPERVSMDEWYKIIDNLVRIDK